MNENKKSLKRFCIDNNDDHLIKDKCIIDDINISFTKEMLYLPSQLNKINISKDDTYIGSKTTKASSKKTHNKFNLINDKTKTLFNVNENIFIEKKVDKDDLSLKTKKIIKNIENTQKEKLINENKTSIINEHRFSLLKSINKTREVNLNLSNKTKIIIESLKKNKIKIEDKKNEILTCDEKVNSLLNSIEYKYVELVNRNRCLPLPVKYKLIYELYTSIENFISITKINNKKNFNTFSNLRNYIRNILKINFTITNLKQILYIVPHFFIIKFIKVDVNSPVFNLNDRLFDKYDILIDIPFNYRELMYKKFPKNYNFLSLFYYTENSIGYNPKIEPLDEQSLKDRNNIFLNLLYLIVKKYHDKFILREKIICPFDPIIEKTWHHSFNLDIECEDIPILDFPPPKQNESVFESQIKNFENTNYIMREAIEKSLNQNQTLKYTTKNKYVSKEFLDKIKRKEEINEIKNQLFEIKKYKDNQNDISNFYVELLSQIKTILLCNNKSMSLIKFSDSLLNSSTTIKNTINSIEQLINILFELSKLFNDLFTIENNTLIGKVVVLHNKLFPIPNKEKIKSILFPEPN